MKKSASMRGRISQLGLAGLLLTAATASQAETISDVVEKQNKLANLDHTISVNERLLTIKDQTEKYSENGTEKKSRAKKQTENVQVEYFGQRPGEGVPEMQGSRKSAEELRKETIMATLDGAYMTEAFPAKGDNARGLNAVVRVGDRMREVSEGTEINGWRVQDIQLDRVRFVNDEFSASKMVYGSR